MIRQRRFAVMLLCAAVLLGRSALADAYDPPAGYYSTATGAGATLKQQLNDLIDSTDNMGLSDELHTSVSYDALRSILQITDADPNNPGHMLLVYSRESLNLSTIVPTNPPNIPGWDSGNTWNREHSWPVSRGLISDSGQPDGTDLHHLRPARTTVNSDRGNQNFGGAYGAQPFGDVIDTQYWYPGNADAGMIARSQFYMAVRYDGVDGGTTNLELGNGDIPDVSPGSNDPPPQLGNLSSLIEWHFAAPPDSFERNRHQIVYSAYQHNRNPFIDRPEFVWSIFEDQMNDSQISIDGSTVDANGGSTRNVDLGRVFVGGSVPAAQSFTLNKAGNDGTYFEVTMAGAATSSVTGRFNAFRTGQTDSRSINVGLNTNTNTATAGLRSGAVTVDNLDVTTGIFDDLEISGHGANDANDTFDVSLSVLDHSMPSFATPTLTTSLTHNFNTVAVGSGAPSFDFDVFNLTTTPGFTANMDFDSIMASGDSGVLTTNAAASAGSLSLAAGLGHTFTAMLSTAAIGSFSATYTLMFSDENLPGALNNSLTLTLEGQVRLLGDYNSDNVVDAADYIVWRATYGQGMTAFDGADGNGDTMIDADDYAVWRAHFGEIAPGVGSSVSRAVPEPASAFLAAIALVIGAMRRRFTGARTLLYQRA